ncbi:TPA: 2-dehydro-3-deoxy-6-phosphogalactonate aldolase [Pseudomonas aeruginosa]|nr:2-dehydro-3-deoxy-6-phosphogalactonate aldolase [Pseudomonas aeruginosa]
MLNSWLEPLPLVAILRGIEPDEAVDIGHTLADAGFHMLEVPLNSPSPLESIQRLREVLGEHYLIGAGTVTSEDQVEAVASVGGDLIVMPHADARLIRAAKASGLRCIPGVATPSEALLALQAGADALKLFPAGAITPDGLKAWRAVLPGDLPVLPVGGITPGSMATWLDAGAQGFCIGTALYAPGLEVAAVASRALAFAQAWTNASTSRREQRP